jgi:hypothetical protein
VPYRAVLGLIVDGAQRLVFVTGLRVANHGLVCCSFIGVYGRGMSLKLQNRSPIATMMLITLAGKRMSGI